jgi:hypothetical protein
VILLFLGSVRSTMIVCISIPLSILTSIVILNSLGEVLTSRNGQRRGGRALLPLKSWCFLSAMADKTI